MNLIWRFIWVAFFAQFASRLKPFDKSTLTLHVLPTDVDLLMHMNNGRYLSLMDLGRTDFMIRCGFFKTLQRARVYPVIASEMIRFRKSLRLFQRFEIETQLLGWDDKFFYLAQFFKSKNTLYALSIVKTCFLHKKEGLQSTQKIVSILDLASPSPALSEWIKNWEKADQAFFDASFSA